MNKSFSKKRLILRLQIFFREYTYILKVWILYLQFKCLHRKKEPKHYFYKEFKDNKDYLQICYNTEYKIHSDHYEYYHKNLLKYVEKPYRYFQMFSSKEYNYKYSNSKRFFPTESPVRITKITPHTFYEGIEFNNILFDSFLLEKFCFHNCSFKNCSFKNITFKKDLVGFATNYIQGFSSCDFFNVTFEKCTINNTFFSMGNLDHINFVDTSLCSSLFHRISFNRVVFSGISTLNNTSFYSPSKSFDISFIGSVEQFHVDTKCSVTAFSYYDKTNITLEEWPKYKIWLTTRHKEVADTLFAIEQIWTANYIREEHNNYANFYYQRKKAETRSFIKWSRIAGYISEFTIGYGEKPFRAFASMGILILIFSFIYLFTGFSPTSDSSVIQYCITGHFDSLQTIFMDYLQSFYYSFFTLISVGQGSASPSSPASQIVMSSELLLGAILMTLFTGTLFRKYTK